MDVEGYIKYDDLEEFIDNSILFRFILQKFLRWYKRDIKPTSMFRGRDHNTNVGGAYYSKHLSDCAIDFNYPKEKTDWSNQRFSEFRHNVIDKVVELAEEHGVCVGIILYNDRNCIHMDFCQRDDHYINDMYE